MAALVLSVIAAGSWAITASHSSAMMAELGLVFLVAGFLEGLPTGFYYHVILYRSLRPRAALPPRWWLFPTRCHSLLTPEEGRRARRWFVLGGIGFLVSVAGLLLLGAAVLTAG